MLAGLFVSRGRSACVDHVAFESQSQNPSNQEGMSIALLGAAGWAPTTGEVAGVTDNPDSCLLEQSLFLS